MNFDSILLFETDIRDNFYPFSIMHPVWELRSGALRIFEKYQKQFPQKRLMFQGRNLTTKSFFERFGLEDLEIKKEDVLIINGAIIPYAAFWDGLEKKYDEFCREAGEERSVVFNYMGYPIAGLILAKDQVNVGNSDKKFLPRILSDFRGAIEQVDLDEARGLGWLWDVLENVGADIEDDFRYFENHFDFAASNAFFINEEKIKIGKNCEMAPGVVIDASDGPVIIGNNTKIMAQATLIGPCSVGNDCIIKVGAKIYENTSIGEVCKVGGEIENSVIQSYSNKQHDGFLGHSFLSEWVNLGADTNTSDLKNTYGDIRVQIERRKMNSGRMFLGLLCGDHSKSGINTMYTTGTIAGICGLHIGGDFLPKYMNSFTWGGAEDAALYELDKALEVAGKVMQRRGKSLTETEHELLKEEFKRTKIMYKKK
jgi:UDP-N-acetylglucosamine diphosphorylase/glucosamine-1-phosphate N-acetyltransferase